MPSLEDVTQRFVADTLPYIEALRAAAAEADAFIAKNAEVIASMAAVGSAMGDMSRASAGSALALRGAGNAEADLGSVSIILRSILQELKDQTLLLGVAFTFLDDKLATLIGHEAAAAAATSALGDAMMAMAAKTRVASAATTGTGGGWRIWGMRVGQALHWIVMGTLEIAATAIPALVAFGAAAAGMYPTIIRISDSQNNLLTASMGVRTALINSVGPLHNLAIGYGSLSQAMAPDAYIIFGSIINALSGHMQAFAGVAKAAGTVLANFASKLSGELSGQLGQQLSGFFANAVKFMIQWGQVLGNLGHTFVNVMSSMVGVSHFLLDVLDALSRAFLMLSSNPIGARLIGIAAAMSAVYRYGLLLTKLWTFLGGPKLVAALAAVISTLMGMVYAFMAADTAAEGFTAAMDTLWASLGPVGWAILALGLAVGAWELFAHTGGDATDSLIAKIQKMPPSVENATKAIAELEGNLHSLRDVQMQQNAAAQAAVDHLGRFGTAMIRVQAVSGVTASDIGKTVAAIKSEANELINLDYGLGQAGMRTGQVGAGMNALEIQTALTDSKVQSLNQAIDAYITLLTGGTSAEAAFVTSMSNLTTGTNRITNILGSGGSVTLSVKQFAAALTHMNQTGAQAWTNFNNVLSTTMPQTLDWFRQAMVLGAATGSDVSHAALDMAKAMVPLAANSSTAQAELLGFLRAQGLNIKSFPELERLVHQNGVGMHDYTKRVDDTTKALSDLSAMAKNAATALNQ